MFKVIQLLVVGRAAAFSKVYLPRNSLGRTNLCTLRGSSNPIGGFMRKTFAGLAGLSKELSVDLSNFQDPADHGLTWGSVKDQLYALQSTEERAFRADLAAGRGKNNAKANLRLFDAPDGTEPRITFYRDSASWCPYCHKVWLCLEERRIPYRVERVNMSCYGNKPPEFRRMQPSGQIPVAIIDGKIYGQSNDIIDALQRLEPPSEQHPPLLPSSSSSSVGSARVQPLLRLERRFFGAWLQWLCGGGSAGARLRNDFEGVLGEVEAALGSSPGGPFFLGDSFSVVDAMYAPFLERAAASLCYFKGYRFRGGKGTEAGAECRAKWPNVNAWFDAMEQKPSYRATMSDFYTHAHDLPPQLGGCPSEPSAAQTFQDAIDGVAPTWTLAALGGGGGVGGGCGGGGGSSSGGWQELLEAQTGEPAWSWVEDAAAKREACEQLAHNSQAVALFAARGAGRPGVPPVMAPLSDPSAVPAEDVAPAVDACLRVVALHLLQGGDDGARKATEAGAEAAPQANNPSALLAAVAESVSSPEAKVAVARSLQYLRDRVGVPRDMSLPAAQHLRARLNWAAEAFYK